LKPILYLIGLGGEGLEKITLETYRLLKKAKVIYIPSTEQAAVQALLAEGCCCIQLAMASEQLDAGLISAQISEHFSEELLLANEQPAVLALPGSPIVQGRLVRTLRAALENKFKIETGFLEKSGSLSNLAGIMAELRSDWGCAWDKEQNHESLKKYLIEEAYEVIEAIDNRDMNNFCEELGDLLLQVVFHCQIAQELNNFDLKDVINGISHKLIRRHPHVFGTEVVNSSSEVLVNWEKIKRQEKGLTDKTPENSEFFKIPKGLPALMAAEEIQKKAAKIHFDWEDYKGPLAKVYEELAELEQETGDSKRKEEEFGDLLFSIVNLSRFLNINSEIALYAAVKKFQVRLNQMLTIIHQENLRMEELSLKKMNYYWEQVKKSEKNGINGSFCKD